MKNEGDALLIGWTTLGSEGSAKELARLLIESELAVCAQVGGPIRSYYRWEGEICNDSEWRVMVKFLRTKSAELEAYIGAEHPYDTPEWVVVQPEHVAAKYLDWAMGSE